MTTDSAPSADQARSFGQAADLYDAIRPSYPADALEWMLGDRPCDVVDVGAGTGLLTRGLIAAGHRVTAVEPDAQMLDKLIATSPGLADGRRGEAEALPLPDASADVITAGQAFHWFDRERALPEIHRVLRPGGVLAPVWNVRDESVPWVAALSDIIGSSKGEMVARDAAEPGSTAAPETAGPRITAGGAADPGYFGPRFAEPEIRTFRHEKPFDGPGLIRLVQSRSYYLTADDRRRRELIAGIEDLIANHPQLAGRDVFAMPYETHAFRVRRSRAPR